MKIESINPFSASREMLNINVIQSLPVAIYICDNDGFITQFNKTAVVLLGYAPETGKDLWSGPLKFFQMDGTPLRSDECPMALTLKEGRPVYGREFILERPDGSRRYIKPYPSPLFDSRGLRSGAINMLEDVTDHKTDAELLEHLTAIVDYSDDAIVSKSLDGTINSWNRGAEKMFGYTAKEITGKNISIIIPPEYQKEEKTILKKLSQNGIIQHYETVRIKKNKEKIYISLTVSPLKDPNGKIIGISKLHGISQKKN